MKHSLVISLALAVAVLGGIVIYDQVRISRLEDRLAAQRAGALQKSVGRSAEAKPVTFLGEKKEESHDDEAEAAPQGGGGDGDRETAGELPPAGDEEGEREGNVFGGLAAMLENPVTRDYFRRDAEGKAMAKWSPFIDALGVGKDVERGIYDLLIEREVFATEKVLTIFDEDAPEAERQAAGEELVSVWKSSEDQFRELLGDDGFNEFKLYEASEPERLELSALRKSMGEGIAGLSAAQEESLMSIMFEERRQFRFTDDYLNGDRFFEVAWTEESFENFRGEFEQLQDRVSTRASAVLSPEQLEVFQSNQAAFRESWIQRKQMEILFLTAE